MSEQLTFFASLDFPGRTVLLLSEMAAKLGVSVRHLQRDAERGALTLLDMRTKGARQPAWRCPIESYHAYVVARLTGPARAEALAELPEATRIALIHELVSGLPEAARTALVRGLRHALAA